MNWKSPLLCLALFSFSLLRSEAAAFDLGASSLPVVLVPGFNHADVFLPITGTAGGFDFSTLEVTSDSAWVTPQVEVANQRVVLRFATSALTNSSYTATISATHGANTDTVFVNATLGVRNIFKLLDDPVRSRMYGIQLNGVNRGAIAVIDPLTGASISSVTVGNRPTGMAVSNDGSELFVINAVDETISVVNLVTLTVTQTVLLPVFDNWGAASTTANIGVGPGNILYYTDGAWAPLLRVYDRSTGTVLQTFYIDGPSSGFGFGDFALNAAKTQLFGWAQFGWSAGSSSSYIGKFNVAANGTLTFAEKTSSTLPTTLSRDPLETPVLIGGDKVFMKQVMVDPATISTADTIFSGPVYSITPGGEIAVTTNAIFQTSTGNKLYDLPITTSVHAITSDYSRLVYYNTTTRTITSLDLIAAIGSEVMGRTLSPADGSIVLPPSSLSWAPLPGAGSYRVYLGTSSAAVTAATTASPEYLGSTTLPDFTLTGTLATSVTYYWRVDAQVGGTFNPGTVYSFTVSPISSSLTKVDTATVQGHPDHRVTVELASDSPGVAWTATANQSWVSFASTTGATPSNLEIILNAAALPAGVHLATVTLSGTGGSLFTLPVKLTVEALAVKILKSDPASSKVYAISENTAVSGAKAYLLEIDSTTEAILRVRQVGTSVTDLAIHNGDNRIYIPNWMPGSLLALNKTTLALERTFAFTPFGGTGYGANDVYRVSAGAAGRIVVEEEDQWVDLSIFNTSTGAELGTIGLREGGGGFDPTGRYYYHGENNSSGAEIYKLDVTGDVFTSLANIRVSSYSYYGSRVVVVSENGNGVFWNGSYFNSDLVEQWTMSKETYSTTPDARLAFGETEIFDTVSRLQVLAMPLTTRVSTYNSATKKLVVQNGAKLRFYTVQLPLSLPTPVLSAGTVTQTSIALSWTDESLETGFTLQQRPAGGSAWTNLTPAVTANQTAFSLSGLPSNTAYEFRIKADAPTLSSGWSQVLSVRTLATPPPTVSLTSALISGASVVLSFTTTGSPTDVIVEKALAETGPWSVVATIPGTATSYSDSDVAPGVTYYYRIKAIRGFGESDYSTTANVTVPLPTVALTSLTNTAGSVQIVMASTHSPATIIIERAASVAGPWSVLASLPGVSTSHLDTTVEHLTTYHYRLKAVRGSYHSPYTEVSSISTPTPDIPATPAGFVFSTVSSAHVGLRWNDVAYESSYQLDRRLASESAWTPLATLAANISSYTDTSVISGSTYVYQLTAINITGASPSVQSNSVTPMSMSVLLEDDFDPNLDPLVWWNTSTASSINGGQGFNGTKALWFGHTGIRIATTNLIHVVPGSRLSFDLRAGNSATDGSAYWDNSENGEGIIIEYSLDGVAWFAIQTIPTAFPAYNTWHTVTVPIPNGAVSSSTQFRWRQLAHSGASQDTWALDNLQIMSSGETLSVIAEQPEPQLVMEGAPATLSVRLSRSGFRFQWFKNDAPISGAIQSTYVIPSSRTSHAGTYHFSATSGSTIVESEKVVLGVVQPVGFTSPLKVKEGNSFMLNMRVFPASLASQLSYDWYRLVEGDLLGIGTVTGADTASLRVAHTTKEAAGSYYCLLKYQAVYTLDVGPYLVSVLSAPTLDPISDETFVVGHQVSIPVLVDDPSATVSVTGLPAGMRYDAKTRRISGTPTVARTSNVIVNAKNPQGSATPVTFELVTTPFPPALVGSYQGILDASTDSSLLHGGQITFQVGLTGATSLVVSLGADILRVSSSTQVPVGESDGQLKFSIKRRSDQVLHFEIPVNNSDLQTGGVLNSTEQQIAEIKVVKNTWTKGSPTSESGVFNVALVPGTEAIHPDHPMGRGFVSLTNAAAGTVRWAGRMADGEAVTGSSLIGAAGDIPVYQALYSAKGSVFGWVQCQSGTASGSLRWTKEDHSTTKGARLYRSGIPAHLLDVSGGRYVRPAIGTPLIAGLEDASNNALLSFTEGGLPISHEQLITLTKAQTVVNTPAGVANPRDVRLSITATTGLFSGSFVLKDVNPANVSQTLTRKVSYSGCLIPGLGLGVGYFLLPELPKAGVRGSSLTNTPIWSGAVELIPAN
jgi:hypothetical protein